jgi:hypothetical protein
MSLPESLSSADAGKTYSTVGSDIDLLAAAKTLGIGAGPCRAIRAGTAGNITIVYASGATDTQDIGAGETIQVKATAISASGTTAAKITVYW